MHAHHDATSNEQSLIIAIAEAAAVWAKPTPRCGSLVETLAALIALGPC